MTDAVHFDPAAFTFLRALARHNDREWFAANKPRYEAHVRQPFLRLIGRLQQPLATISSHYRADPRPQGGSLFRIHRDTRFANDKTPYKTWSGARFFHERGREVAAPSFYLHLQPGASFVGAGLWHPEPPTLNRIRHFIVDNPAAWTAATRSKAFARHYELGGESLVRPPRGYDPAHPLIDDLKRKSFTAWIALDDATMTSARLPTVVAGHFRGLAPLVDYLCASLDLPF
jgi:uncharacterized protein (TIGR02453 family)